MVSALALTATFDTPPANERWTEVVLRHWRVPPVGLEALLPPGVVLDPWAGAAWVGVLEATCAGWTGTRRRACLRALVRVAGEAATFTLGERAVPAGGWWPAGRFAVIDGTLEPWLAERRLEVRRGDSGALEVSRLHHAPWPLGWVDGPALAAPAWGPKSVLGEVEHAMGAARLDVSRTGWTPWRPGSALPA